MKNSKRNVALIGLGYWGKNVLRNLYELGVLHTVCDSNLNTLEERKERFPDVNYTDSPEDVAANKEIKAVAIATPAVTHYEFAKLFLKAGKDVFVEKPLALTVSEGKEIVETAKKEKRILMIGHILQYHPAVNKLRNMISKGELGKIRYVYSNRLNIGKLRTEENILWSFAPHDISVLLMLIGEEPVSVSVFGGDYINKGIDDVTLTTLEFKNGVKGHVFVSWLHPYKEQKLIVVGTKAMVVFDDVSKEKLFYYPHSIEWKEGKIPVAQKADFKVIPIEEGEPLKLELEHFTDCIIKRKTPKTDGEEGLRVLKVLEEAGRKLSNKGSTMSKEKNKVKNAFVHEAACVDEGVKIGEGTKIWHYTHIQSGSTIGKNCVLGQNVNIGNNVTIGNFVKIQNNVSVYEGVTLEDYVFCGPSMVFTNIADPRSKYPQVGSKYYVKTLVKEGASLGANSTIVCGITIGKHSFIGAGAVVTKDVPDFALVIGNPAKIKGWMSEAGNKLKFAKDGTAFCKKANKKYKLANDKVFEVK